MRIFLIGYMGSGKSTLGRNLASELECSFIDMDKFIEEKYLKSISAIFAEEGEEAFRIKEREALIELTTFQNIVIGTGGGAPFFYNNMEVMNQSGTTIYLNVSLDELTRRLQNAQSERPLLKDKSETELRAFIQEAMSWRLEFYERATHTVAGDNVTAKDIVRLLNL